MNSTTVHVAFVYSKRLYEDEMLFEKGLWKFETNYDDNKSFYSVILLYFLK